MHIFKLIPGRSRRVVKGRTGVVLLALGGLLASQVAFATAGYFPVGIGAKNKAMAGAGMAMPEDAISIVNNPAVAAFLGNRMDAGLTVLLPRRNFSTFGEGSKGEDGTFSFAVADIDSDKDVYYLPEFAGTRQLQNDSAFAWAFYMRNGIGTKLKGGAATFNPTGNGQSGIETLPGIYGDETASLEMSQAYVDITWAKQWGGKTGLGIAAVLAAQSLKIKGAGGLAKYTETFAASSGAIAPDKLSGNGNDVNYGAGLKLGIHQLLGEHFSFGIMYQTKINVGSSSRYGDLLADGGNWDIPAWARIGFTWRPTQKWSFSIDGQKVFYSKVKALGNSFENVYDCPTTGLGGTDLSRCLGGKNGPGFGWKDVPAYSFGTSWAVTDKWTLRAGMSISDQPVPKNENFLNPLLIDLDEAHYTFGFTRKLNNGHELSFSFMYSEEESIERPNQLDPQQRVLLTNDEFDFQLTYSWGN